MSSLIKNEEEIYHNTKIKKINGLLNVAKTRSLGLELLDSFLPQCSDQEFVEWCVSWMQSCCKDNFTKNKGHTLILLSRLFTIASNYPELKKTVSFFITTRYFDYFLKNASNCQTGWHCTEICFTLFRGACGPFRETVDECLNNKLEKNVYIFPSALRCIALLPSLGGGGNEGINYSVNWQHQFLKYTYLCHSILNELFKSVQELQEYDTAEYSHTSGGKDLTVGCLLAKLKNCCQILCHMLMNKFPGSKWIPIDQTFQLICRGLAVSFTTIGKNQTADIMNLKKVLPDVHVLLHSLLNAVIVVCKNQVLPYSHLICKLIKQSLEWTNTFNEENEKACKVFRVAVYETLCNWLVATGGNSCLETISKSVISNAVKDIQLHKTFTHLKESKQTKNQILKHIKCQGVDSTNNCLSFAALKSLQFFIKYLGPIINMEEQKFLQETVIKLLVDIQNSSNFGTNYSTSSFPISSKEELFWLLGELVNQPSFTFPPPTNFALRIFSKGLNNNSFNITLFCLSKLNTLINILHSRFDNAGFSVAETVNDLNRTVESLQSGVEHMEVVKEDLNIAKEIEEPRNVNKENNENNKNSSKGFEDLTKEIDSHGDESDASSCEDSIITVSYCKEEDYDKNTSNSFEEKNEKDVLNELVRETTPKNEPPCKKQKVSNEETTPETVKKSSMDLKEETLRRDSDDYICGKVTRSPTGSPKKLTKVTNEGSDGTKNITNSDEEHSPEDVDHLKKAESTEEELKAKGANKRYFLRSKTGKAHSEEPEDVIKELSGGEKFQSPSVKILPKNLSVGSSSVDRPKTRAYSKLEKNDSRLEGLSPKKNVDDDDDENILDSFYDSLVE